MEYLKVAYLESSGVCWQQV